jgi:hypothetical protein
VLTVYKKMSFLAILLVGVCSLFFTSCNQAVPNEKCSLTFSINPNNLLDKARDISPIYDSDLITSYKLTLNGPKDESQEINLADSTGTISDLSIGYWTIDVEAMNSKDNVLATGQSVIYLTNQTNNIDIQLEQLEGQGNLVLSFIWDEEQVVQGQTHVACTIAADDGTLVDESKYEFINIGDNDGKSGVSLLVDELDAGSYTISAKLISNDICISGIVEPIRIVNSSESEGVVTFVIGDKANHFTFNIIKNVMLPVSGTIEVSSSQTHIDEDFTLSFVADELPAGVDESTLRYQWYCEGMIIPGATSDVVTTRSTLGSHRYDIIVKNSKLGSTGGTSLTVETINPE